jgi:hypothetical protein
MATGHFHHLERFEAYMLFVLEIMRGNDQTVTSAPPVP